VILTSTEAQVPGYVITAYKGIIQGETWTELLLLAEALGANAVLNTCFDDALGLNTLFHGSAVVLRRKPSASWLPRCAQHRGISKPNWTTDEN
jgi:uncharacterized protein YbjQ (UPF0145 family)